MSTTATPTTLIVWNGCDGYVELADAPRRGYDVRGTTLYHGAASYEAFGAAEIPWEGIPVDDDGEKIVDGIYATETGRFYTAL